MKLFKSLILSSVATSVLFGGTVSVPYSGWNLMGAMENINPSSTFNASTVKSVWAWNATTQKWIGYAPPASSSYSYMNTLNTNNAITLFGTNDSIPIGSGYWINTTSANNTYTPTVVDNNNTNNTATSGFTTNMIVGKTFYALYVDSYAKYDYGRVKLIFNANGTITAVFDDNTFTAPYSITDGKIIISGEHAATLTLVSVTDDYYNYLESGVDEGGPYQTEYAALYFNKDKRDVAYNALPKNPLLPSAIYAKKDSSYLYIKMEFLDIQHVINAMGMVDGADIIGPTLNLDPNQELRFYKNQNNEIISTLFSSYGIITTEQGSNYLEAKIPLTMLSGSNIESITGQTSNDYADDYYFYLGNGNATGSIKLSETFHITSEYSALSLKEE